MGSETIVVSEVMSGRPATISSGRTVGAALDAMRASDVRHLPVVDAGGKLVGILSDRDLLAIGEQPEAGEILVRDVMTREVSTVGPDARAYEASALMLDRKFGALPVVDLDGRLLGIVTETDFLRIAHRALGGERMAVDDR